MPNINHPKICPICFIGRKFAFIKDYSLKEKNFSLYQCQDCQVQFYLPFKSIEDKGYEQRNNYKISEIVKPRIFRGYHKKFFKINKNFSRKMKVLDLGCGTGEFLSELEKKGCEVWGADFDSSAILMAKKYFNLKNIYALSFKDFFRNNNLPQFDFVIIFEVMQYLEDPIEFVKNVQKVLKPDGKIILSVPSRQRMMAELDRWDLPPYCLTRWNNKAISNLFSKINFKMSYICYVEQFKILVGAINAKTRLGLVNKTISISGSKGNKPSLFPKIIYFFGRYKEFIIAFLPAFILWLWGKITKRENGIIFVTLEKIHG
ncbi:class I SAM-dependent methyltransferase [Candidatus Parcubacteria bacterium]|nr:class I SAM-dependent methyltransferase [Candidatus Parcubacteria bacterium]